MPRKTGGKLRMKMNAENVVLAVLVVVLVVLVAYYVHLLMKNREEYGEKPVVIFYFANWCPHCKSMMGEWDSFKNDHPNNVDVMQFESEEVPEDHKDRVEGYPTILAEMPNGELKNYNGDRTAAGMRSWCASL